MRHLLLQRENRLWKKIHSIQLRLWNRQNRIKLKISLLVYSVWAALQVKFESKFKLLTKRLSCHRKLQMQICLNLEGKVSIQINWVKVANKKIRKIKIRMKNQKSKKVKIPPKLKEHHQNFFKKQFSNWNKWNRK